MAWTMIAYDVVPGAAGQPRRLIRLHLHRSAFAANPVQRHLSYDGYGVYGARVKCESQFHFLKDSCGSIYRHPRQC